jgi:hypothetical protein
MFRRQTRKPDKNLVDSVDEMQSKAELSLDEKELILKALSYYQVHLFDELAKKSNPSADADYRKATIVIKKIHGTIEKHA